MVVHSSLDRVYNWLQSVDDTHEFQRDDDTKSITISNPFQSRVYKRKAARMAEDTPRAKKQRTTGLETPRGSATSKMIAASLSRSETRTESSITAPSSRSASPTKRQRDADIEYGKPMIKLLSRKASKAWRALHVEEVPKLEQLIDRIQRPADVAGFSEVESNLAEILEDVERYNLVANEETWSDFVVFPTLRLARKMSKYTKDVHVINVKTISVWPTELLPTHAQIATKPRKRVDYSIGLNITDQIACEDEIVQWAGNHTLSQCQHMLVNNRVLCSHVEIKAEAGAREAQFQLGVWCAAQFRKQDNLWLQRNTEYLGSCETLKKPTLAPIPVWFWQGKTVQLWIAVIDPQRENMTLLNEKEYRIDEEDPKSLFEIIDAVSRVMRWGYEEYLPWFRALIGRDDLNAVTTNNIR